MVRDKKLSSANKKGNTTHMENTKTPNIQIDGKTFPLSDLGDNAKAQVQNLAIVDAEIKRLQTQIGIAQAAQQSFIAALRNELNKPAA